MFLAQEVTGLLQHELQKSAVLLHTMYCQHSRTLLQDAASLEVLLRMVPLFEDEQQTAVYRALHSSLLRSRLEGRRIVCILNCLAHQGNMFKYAIVTSSRCVLQQQQHSVAAMQVKQMGCVLQQTSQTCLLLPVLNLVAAHTKPKQRCTRPHAFYGNWQIACINALNTSGFALMISTALEAFW